MTDYPHTVTDPVLPWLGNRLTPMQTAAAPLLVVALRRLFLMWPQPALTVDRNGTQRWGDFAPLDKDRPTMRRLASAAIWHRAHDHGPRPYMHYLPHAGYVLRACGLTPSRVHTIRLLTRTPSGAADEVLLACAHLSQRSAFTDEDLDLLVGQHDWTLRDLLAWSLAHPARHLAQCVRAGLSYAELREMVRAGTVPDSAQVEFMTAMRLSPEDLSA